MRTVIPPSAAGLRQMLTATLAALPDGAQPVSSRKGSA
jgi:hypothetical protein